MQAHKVERLCWAFSGRRDNVTLEVHSLGSLEKIVDQLHAFNSPRLCMLCLVDFCPLNLTGPFEGLEVCYDELLLCFAES